MQNFKRIQDKTGNFRYYVNGKRITTKQGAKSYVKQNLNQLNKANLSKQEQKSYQATLNAQKGAAAASKRTKESFRFKGKFLDKSIAKYLEKITPGQRNLEKRYPGVKDYGQLLKELQKDLQSNMNLFALDEASQYGLPNEKRNRVILENTADIIETLKNDFPGYSLNVITKTGDKIIDYKKAIVYIAKWENSEIKNETEGNPNAAYVRISYFPKIDIVNKILTIDLEPKQDEKNNRYSVQVQTSP